MSDEERELSKTCFFEKTGFPGVIGCVDGTHVQIIEEDKHLFLNRKGHFSLNVMIISDYKMRVRGVNANFQGANHDSRIWALSPERGYFEINYLCGSRGSWLLGDSGYPLEPWLMTLFRTPAQQSAESRFNSCHRRARNIVERSIGLLKCRFRCLLGARQLHYAPLKAAQIVNVCCALHNICLQYDSTYEILDHEDENNMEEELEFHEIQADLLRSQAAIIRNEIVQFNFNT